MKITLKDIVPPLVGHGLNALLGRSIRFTGPHASWQEALGKSDGYDAGKILETVSRATHKVVAGKARHERDGVLLDRVDPPFPVITAFLRAALERDRRLSVVDFGGALGSSYRECRPFLAGAVRQLAWTVVEQPNFADYGKQHFSSEELTFCASLSEAMRAGVPDVVLMSSVLQYLPRPWDALGRILDAAPRYVVLDRTVVNDSNEDALYVQHVPPRIYPAAYPCWSLSESILMEKLARRYDLLADFASLPFPALRRIGASFKGYLFQLRSAA